MWTKIRLERYDLDLQCLSNCLPKRLQIFQQTTNAYDCFVICFIVLSKIDENRCKQTLASLP